MLNPISLLPLIVHPFYFQHFGSSATDRGPAGLGPRLLRFLSTYGHRRFPEGFPGRGAGVVYRDRVFHVLP
jgi:hypothetical protein